MEEAKLLLTSTTYREFSCENVQGIDIKWDEVLLSMTKVPDDDVLEKLHKKQLHFPEELKLLMSLYLQNTVQKGKPSTSSQLKQVRRLKGGVRPSGSRV